MDILSDVNVNGSIQSNGVSVKGLISSSYMKVSNSICANNFNGSHINLSDGVRSNYAVIKDSVEACRIYTSEFTTSELRIAGKMEVPTYGDPTKNYYLSYVSYCLLVPQGCNKFYLNDYAYGWPTGGDGSTIFANILDNDSGKYVYMDIQRVYVSYGDYYNTIATRSDLDEKKYLIKYLQLTDN